MKRSVLATRLPDAIIFEIVNNDLINKAYPVHENEVMKVLSKIWYKYVEKGQENLDCNVCKARILACLRASQQELESIAIDYTLNKNK